MTGDESDTEAAEPRDDTEGIWLPRDCAAAPWPTARGNGAMDRQQAQDQTSRRRVLVYNNTEPREMGENTATSTRRTENPRNGRLTTSQEEPKPRSPSRLTSFQRRLLRSRNPKEKQKESIDYLGQRAAHRSPKSSDHRS